jgi:phosphopantothenoylcysteine decarboxylase/phosphopantothenate--cysteine ligase
MDEDMWKHPSTRANLALIQEYGNGVIPVEKGELASGLYGDGRMAEPETILTYIRQRLSGGGGKGQDLVGKKALVTAGPTYEAIDPVRFIGNHSSGKMGIAIARELAGRGARVDLVLGPTSLSAEYPGVTVHKVTSAEEMYNACAGIFPGVDIAVMSAAVADFRPVAPAGEKIKKKDDRLVLELTKTKDILMTLGQQKKGQLLVGFALETTGERAYALDKLRTKNADLIVLNSLNDAGAGFGYDTNKITIFDKLGGETVYEMKPKQQVAADIVDRVVNMLYA